MGMNLTERQDLLLKRRSMMVFDDFTYYVSGDQWTSVTGGAATAAVADGANGILTLSCVDSTLNREVYVRSTTALFNLANNKPIYCECQLQYSEGNTNKAGIIFGLMNAVAAGALADTTLVPKSSFSGAVIFKAVSTTYWQTESSVTTVNTLTTVDNLLVPGGANYQRLGILIEPVSSTLAEVTYYIDAGSPITASAGGVLLQARNNLTNKTLIKDQLTYTGASGMQLFVGVKNGSTTAETLNVDYMAATILR